MMSLPHQLVMISDPSNMGGLSLLLMAGQQASPGKSSAQPTQMSGTSQADGVKKSLTFTQLMEKVRLQILSVHCEVFQHHKVCL